jgi:hypothetical protein
MPCSYWRKRRGLSNKAGARVPKQATIIDQTIACEKREPGVKEGDTLDLEVAPDGGIRLLLSAIARFGKDAF